VKDSSRTAAQAATALLVIIGLKVPLRCVEGTHAEQRYIAHRDVFPCHVFCTCSIFNLHKNRGSGDVIGSASSVAPLRFVRSLTSPLSLSILLCSLVLIAA